MLANSKHDLIIILRESHFSFATLIGICGTQVIGGIISEFAGQIEVAGQWQLSCNNCLQNTRI